MQTLIYSFLNKWNHKARKPPKHHLFTIFHIFKKNNLENQDCFIVNRVNICVLSKNILFWKSENTLSRAHRNMVVSGTLWILRLLLGANNSFHVFEKRDITRLGDTQSIVFYRILKLLKKSWLFCQIWWNTELWRLFLSENTEFSWNLESGPGNSGDFWHALKSTKIVGGC